MDAILQTLKLEGLKFSLQNFFKFCKSSVVNTTLMSLVTFYGANLHSAPQTPSQALPKMFQKQPSLDYYEFKKQDQVIPDLPVIDVKQQEDTGIKITARNDNYFSSKGTPKHNFS